MEDVVIELTRAAEGLHFLSESEYPFEPVFYETNKSRNLEVHNNFLEFIPVSEGTKIEKQDVDYFFRNMIRILPEHSAEEREIAAKFISLKDLIKKKLKNSIVYRLGEIQVQAYIMGETEQGNFAGLKTVLIET